MEATIPSDPQNKLGTGEKVLKQNLGVGLVGVVLGTLLAIFGGYILYEKAILSISLGYSHERVGVVSRSDSAFSFWLGVCVYGVCSLFILIAGIVLALRSIMLLFSSEK